MSLAAYLAETGKGVEKWVVDMLRVAYTVESGGLLRKILFGIVNAVKICGELLRERLKERDELLVAVMFAAEKVEIDPFILAFEFLNSHSEFARQRDQGGVIRVDQLTAELTKHRILVEVIFRQHATADSLAPFEDFARHAGLQ
jgi:hypothetical protein